MGQSRCDCDHHLVCSLHPTLLHCDGLGHHVLGHLHHLPWLRLRHCRHVLLRHCSAQSISIGNPGLMHSSLTGFQANISLWILPHICLYIRPLLSTTNSYLTQTHVSSLLCPQIGQQSISKSNLIEDCNTFYKRVGNKATYVDSL